MVRIEILSGAYGHRPIGSSHIQTYLRGDICEVDEARARRLVERGCAKIVADEAPVDAGAVEREQTSVTAVEPENAAESGVGDAVDSDKLKGMKLAELKALASDLGIDASRMRSKAEVIAAICAPTVDGDIVL